MLCATAGVIAASAAPAVHADDEGLYWPPRIEAELVVEIQNDNTFDSDDEDAELNNLTTLTELDVNTYFAEPLFLNVHFTMEQTGETKPGEDCYFCEHGVFVEGLNLNYESDWWFVYGGKFGPNFAIAWDAAPGIYGTDIGEDDIELAERVGVGGGVTFLEDDAYGAHTLSASVFFSDTSALSDSFGTERGRLDLDDGGPSNTESLESFAVAIDGEEIAALPGFRYHIGGARQAVDRINDDDGNELPDSETEDEYRFAAAGEWALEVDEDITVTPLLEYVRFWNAEGTKDEDRDYLTAAGLLEYQNWNLALSYTGKFVENPDGSDRTDYAFQASAGYAFDFGVTADVGYKYDRAQEIDSHIFGVLLTYEIGFGT